MNSSSRACSSGVRRRAGFSLVEVMIASTLAVIITAAVMAVVLMSLRTVRKTQMLAAADQTTRLVQDHISRQLSIAVSRDNMVPKMGFQPELSDGGSPRRYARLIYRVPLGQPVRVDADTLQTSKELVLRCPSDVVPEVGDLVMLTRPLTDGLRIAAVSDPGPTAGLRNVTVTFATTLEAGMKGTPAKVEAETSYLPIYRARKYEVTVPNAAGLCELRWWPNLADSSKYDVLSTNVPASGRYMFRPQPDDLAAIEHSMDWSFSYSAPDPVSPLLGGVRQFWEVNRTQGSSWARSGDLVSGATVTPDNFTTSIATTSTTSTTSVPTTSTTTSKSTTTKTTSIKTTSKSTTKTTSVSTTSKSTTKTTSKSTTKTTSASTTSKSTSKSTSASTTSKSTTKSTTKPTTTVRQDG